MFQVQQLTLLTVCVQLILGAPLHTYTCTQCPPGYGVTSPCTSVSDTACAPCSVGYYSKYSNAKHACFPCSRCGDGLFQLHMCNSTHDAFCELCSWTGAPDNLDYLRKCLGTNKEIKSQRKPAGKNLIPTKFPPSFWEGESIQNDWATDPLDDEDDIILIDEEDDDTKPLNEVKTDEDKHLGNHHSLHVRKDINIRAARKGSGKYALYTTHNYKLRRRESGRMELITYRQTDGPEESSASASGDDLQSGDDMLSTMGSDTAFSSQIPKNKFNSSRKNKNDKGKANSKRRFPDVDPHQEVSIEASTTDNKTSILAIFLAAVIAGLLFFAICLFYTCASRKKDDSSKTIDRLKSLKHSALGNSYDTAMSFEDRASPSPPVVTVTSDDEDDPETLILEPEIMSNGLLPTVYTGNHQSPIDLDPDAAEFNENLQKHALHIDYTPHSSYTLTNTGSTVKLQVNESGSVISGGPLGARHYTLDHVLFHWGSADTDGSEHTIRGLKFSGELHLVHWNRVKYSNMAEAMRREDGLAYLAVFIQVGDSEHEALKSISNGLSDIQYKGESLEVPGDEFNLMSLLPDNIDDYWTYSGSLTSPPYHETVTWIVFKNPITLHAKQMEKFRDLLSYERDEGHVHTRLGNDHLVDNYRDTNPVGDRNVWTSFSEC